MEAEIRKYTLEEIKKLTVIHLSLQMDDKTYKNETIFKVLDVEIIDYMSGFHFWPVYDFEDGTVKKLCFYGPDSDTIRMMKETGFSFEVGQKYKMSGTEAGKNCTYKNSITKLDDSNIEICRFTFE